MSYITYCTKERPMPKEAEKEFNWIHVDAVEVDCNDRYIQYECPHCKKFFSAKREKESE